MSVRRTARSRVAKTENCYFCTLKLDDDPVVHHLDENKYNNNRSNLVRAHRRCHLIFHKTGYKRPDNTSGFVGVHYRKGRNHWVARKVVSPFSHRDTRVWSTPYERAEGRWV